MLGSRRPVSAAGRQAGRLGHSEPASTLTSVCGSSARVRRACAAALRCGRRLPPLALPLHAVGTRIAWLPVRIGQAAVVQGVAWMHRGRAHPSARSTLDKSAATVCGGRARGAATAAAAGPTVSGTCASVLFSPAVPSSCNCFYLKTSCASASRRGGSVQTLWRGHVDLGATVSLASARVDEQLRGSRTCICCPGLQALRAPPAPQT